MLVSCFERRLGGRVSVRIGHLVDAETELRDLAPVEHLFISIIHLRLTLSVPWRDETCAFDILDTVLRKSDEVNMKSASRAHIR